MHGYGFYMCTDVYVYLSVHEYGYLVCGAHIGFMDKGMFYTIYMLGSHM